MRTALMIPPTLEEAKLQAFKIGLPETEAEKFWFYYDSKGWRVGKSPMKSWTSAMAGWKLRWQERVGAGPPGNNGWHPGIKTPTLRRQEVERLLRESDKIE